MTKKEYLTRLINKILQKHHCKTFVVVNLSIDEPNVLEIFVVDKSKVNCVKQALEKELEKNQSFIVKVLSEDDEI